MFIVKTGRGKGHMLIWSENSLGVKWIYDWITIVLFYCIIIRILFFILLTIIHTQISLQGYFHSRLACGPYPDRAHWRHQAAFFYRFSDPCENNPCLNNGGCVSYSFRSPGESPSPIQIFNSKCICKNGWTGDHCQTPAQSKTFRSRSILLSYILQNITVNTMG